MRLSLMRRTQSPLLPKPPDPSYDARMIYHRHHGNKHDCDQGEKQDEDVLIEPAKTRRRCHRCAVLLGHYSLQPHKDVRLVANLRHELGKVQTNRQHSHAACARPAADGNVQPQNECQKPKAVEKEEPPLRPKVSGALAGLEILHKVWKTAGTEHAVRVPRRVVAAEHGGTARCVVVLVAAPQTCGLWLALVHRDFSDGDGRVAVPEATAACQVC